MPIHSVAWSRDSKCWRPGRKRHHPDLECGDRRSRALERAQGPSAVLSVAWSPDGKTLASGRAAYRVQLWDASSNKLLHDGAGWSPVHRVSWSGTTVAGSNATSTVRFWNALTGQPRAVLVADEDWLAVVNAQGHLGTTPEVKASLVYIVQTEKAQEFLDPREFITKSRWKNLPPFRELSGK